MNEVTLVSTTNIGTCNSGLPDFPVLSVRQPWAWFIIYAGKDIENRNWRTNYRGRILVHAARGCTKREYGEASTFANKILLTGSDPSAGPDVVIPPLSDIERGGIIGSVEIVDCVYQSQSRWFVGRFGFVLRDSTPLPFYPCKGRLGFFSVATLQPPSRSS